MGSRVLGTIVTIALAVGSLAAAMPAQATSLSFVFDGVPSGGVTPGFLSSGGVTASFAGSIDPGGFQVEPTFFSFPGSKVLVSQLSGETLTITFSTALTSFSEFFGTDGPGPIDLTALIGGPGGTVVGTSSAIGTPVITSPEGIIDFNGGPFDTIILSDPTDDAFAVGNLTVDTASDLPEPSSMALFGVAILGLGALARREHSTRV